RVESLCVDDVLVVHCSNTGQKNGRIPVCRCSSGILGEVSEEVTVVAVGFKYVVRLMRDHPGGIVGRFVEATVKARVRGHGMEMVEVVFSSRFTRILKYDLV